MVQTESKKVLVFTRNRRVLKVRNRNRTPVSGAIGCLKVTWHREVFIEQLLKIGTYRHLHKYRICNFIVVDSYLR